MKTFIIVLALLTSSAFSDDTYLSSLKHLNFSDGLNKMIERFTVIRYNDSTKNYSIYFQESLGSTIIDLDSAKIDTLTSFLEKYVEWNKKASSMKVKLDKKIGSMSSVGPAWILGSNWHFAKECTVTFGFFSQSTSRHQVYISFSTMYDKYNKYSKHRPKTVYLTYTQAKKLLKAFSSKELRKFESKLAGSKKISSQFN